MTDSLLVESTNAKLMWVGAGYSAFVSATASKTELDILYIDADKTVRYSYKLVNPNQFFGYLIILLSVLVSWSFIVSVIYEGASVQKSRGNTYLRKKKLKPMFQKNPPHIVW